MDGLLSESSVMPFGNSEPNGIDLPLWHLNLQTVHSRR